MRHVDLVRKETLAELAGELGLDALIEMTPGEEQGGNPRERDGSGRRHGGGHCCALS